MFSVDSKAVELALMLLHVGALSGSAALINVGRLLEALLSSLVASVCVLILIGSIGLAQIIKMKVMTYVAKHEARIALLKSHSHNEE
jgi:hypothetical protein